MSGALVVRRASVGDATPLAAFGERTFRETFAGDNTPEDMTAYLAQSFGEEIQRSELESPAITVLLAERDGQMLGYAVLREGRGSPPAVVGERPVELQRLYVESAAKGQGVARELLQRVEQEAVRRGGDLLWLGVWERNPRAIAFYEKCGFTDVGTQVFLLGSDRQIDRLMSKPLAP